MRRPTPDEFYALELATWVIIAMLEGCEVMKNLYTPPTWPMIVSSAEDTYDRAMEIRKFRKNRRR